MITMATPLPSEFTPDLTRARVFYADYFAFRVTW